MGSESGSTHSILAAGSIRLSFPVETILTPLENAGSTPRRERFFGLGQPGRQAIGDRSMA